MLFLFHITFFFFNDTATTEIYTLSLHDALPISDHRYDGPPGVIGAPRSRSPSDRKSTRLNSSHVSISYAVFCLKKKKNIIPALIFNKIKHRKNTITYEIDRP